MQYYAVQYNMRHIKYGAFLCLLFAGATRDLEKPMNATSRASKYSVDKLQALSFQFVG